MPEARGVIRKVAAERIEILYDAAVRAFPEDRELSEGYIRLLEEIGRHYKVKIGKRIAAQICKRCSQPLIEGTNSQIRIIAKDKRIIYRCIVCGGTNSLAFKDPTKMKENRVSVEINAPIKKVFKFTINPKNTNLWVPGMVKEETNESKIRLGTEYRNVDKMGKWTKYVVTAFVPDRIFEMEQIDSPYRVRYTYEPLEANKTRLTYFEWVRKGFLEGPFEISVLAGLKRLLEE